MKLSKMECFAEEWPDTVFFTKLPAVEITRHVGENSLFFSTPLLRTID